MNIFRRFGLNLVTVVFSSCLSLLVLAVSLFVVFDTPNALKEALRTSGIYSTSVGEAVSSQQGSETATSLPTRDAGVQRALQLALPPAFLQNSSELIIDGTYRWVHSAAPTPDFTIDLAPVKQRFADNLAAYVQQKLSSLPRCIQYTTPPSSVGGLLALACLPSGITPTSVADDVRQEALRSSLFTEGNTLNASAIKDADGKPLIDRLAFIPALHHYFILSLFLLPGLVLLAAAGILYLNFTKRLGTRRIAWLLITAGILGMIVAAAGVWLLHTGVTLFAPSSLPTFQGKLFTVMEILMVDLRTWWFGFGAGYTLIGIALLIILKLNPIKPKLVMGNSQTYTPPPLSRSNDIPPDLFK